MRKYENFCRALDNLKIVYATKEPLDVLTLIGSVALFQICFEQAWKAAKECLWEEGFSEASTGSPRQVLKTAYQAGLIEDMDGWLAMLAARNDGTHAYNKEVAVAIVKDTKKRYYPLLEKLRETLKSRMEQKG